jgi:hypothetical protein
MGGKCIILEKKLISIGIHGIPSVYHPLTK